MSCNGVCERYRAKRNYNIPSRYTEGQKRCSVCEFLLNGMKISYCTCCNYKLRTRSFRGFKMRKKQREEIINR
jgi:hypothetical protein